MNDKSVKNTILIVDDQPDNLNILLALLRRQDFKVLVAQNGEECLQITQHASPDLILLDVMMPPGISGFEVCKRLKAQKNTLDIPVIFMTALSDTVDKIKGFESGAADYITKPFQYDELLARVNAHLSIRKLQQELKAQNQLLKDEIGRSKNIEEARQKTNQLLQNTLKLQDNSSDGMKKCQAELKKSNAALEMLTDAITHDLKPPLKTIITLSTRVEKSYSLKKDISIKTLQQLGEAGQEAFNLVENLLLLVGIEKQGKVESVLVEMSDIVTFVVEQRLAYLIKQYQAKVKLATVWPTVPGVRSWLEVIWISYISNALKYAGKRPNLELGATPIPHDKVRFWIRDNGQGLTKIEIDKLLTPSHLPQVQVKGNGSDLSQVQHFLELMGGEAGVDKSTKGSLFYFTLPAY
ncbi:MAG TPA: response regulator [Thiotrichaceae bacterium]|nr:response regulator [Thiotrichaceae bacterium]